MRFKNSINIILVVGFCVQSAVSRKVTCPLEAFGYSNNSYSRLFLLYVFKDNTTASYNLRKKTEAKGLCSFSVFVSPKQSTKRY